MKKLIPLLIIGALVGCQGETSDVDQNAKNELTFESMTRPSTIDGQLYVPKKGNIDFGPLDVSSLPKGSKNVRYEGNGWYTFLWKGGCYIASVQHSGRYVYNWEVRLTLAHNKQVCDLTVDFKQEPVEYSHSSTQY